MANAAVYSKENLVVKYDICKFPFRQWFNDALGTTELENLHGRFGVNPKNFVEKIYEAQSSCRDSLPSLQDIVRTFVDAVLEPMYGPIISYQEVPTIRFNFAVDSEILTNENDSLVDIGHELYLRKYYLTGSRFANFHRDRDYGLQPGTINLWIPVTMACDFNALWLGGADCRGFDAVPVAVSEGEALMFDGGNRWHGVVWNTTNITRVSFDLRFLPERCWRDGHCGVLDQIVAQNAHSLGDR